MKRERKIEHGCIVLIAPETIKINPDGVILRQPHYNVTQENYCSPHVWTSRPATMTNPVVGGLWL
jgi:hypothetical protein